MLFQGHMHLCLRKKATKAKKAKKDVKSSAPKATGKAKKKHLQSHKIKYSKKKIGLIFCSETTALKGKLQQKCFTSMAF